MFEISNQEVDFECPQCKAKNTVTLGQAAREEVIPCVGCGKTIALTDGDGSVKKSVSSINESLKKLENTLKSFGK
jgi:Zn ribbon nucleic-acid-binding protein